MAISDGSLPAGCGASVVDETLVAPEATVVVVTEPELPQADANMPTAATTPRRRSLACRTPGTLLRPAFAAGVSRASGTARRHRETSLMLMTGAASETPSSAGGAVSDNPLVTVALDVAGMHCPSCAALIEESLLEQAGVANATVDLEAAHAAVTFDPGVAALDDLCAVVAGLGYEVALSPA